jgi:hypothetical protein
VDAKVRERLSVSRQGMQFADVNKFNIKKVNDVTIKEQYQIKLLTCLQLAPLQNLDDVDITTT